MHAGTAFFNCAKQNKMATEQEPNALIQFRLAPEKLLACRFEEFDALLQLHGLSEWPTFATSTNSPAVT